MMRIIEMVWIWASKSIKNGESCNDFFKNKFLVNIFRMWEIPENSLEKFDYLITEIQNIVEK